MKSLAIPTKAKGIKQKKKVDAGKAGVIYARYSSHNQKDASIEQQVEQCLGYAKDKGISITAIYSDRAVSGKSDKRDEFQRMMKDAEHGKFTYVVSWKSNRIGRNMLQAMMNEERLIDLGVRVLYVEEDFDDTASGRFALRSMMNVNQFYSENMAEDIRRGLYDNAANCKITNGNLPFGYKKGDDDRYAIDSPKDDIVRDIFARVARGEAFVDIANYLNAMGIKTTRGKPFGKNSFHAMIVNERYTGVYIYGDVRIEGGVPQIVSKELFFKVQEVLKTKNNPRGRYKINGDYLLTGKLYCMKCGSAMMGLSGHSRNGSLHHYYSCKERNTENHCRKLNVRRDVIEIAVAQAIKNYALQDDIIEWIADSAVAYNKRQEANSHVTLMEDELAENKKAIKNLMTAIEQGIITETTKDRLLELERNQSKLVANIATARADIIVVPRKDIVTGLEMFRDGDVEDVRYRARLFNTFLVAVYLDDDNNPNNLKIVFSFSGNKNTIEIPLNPEKGEEKDGAPSGSFKRTFAPPKETP